MTMDMYTALRIRIYKYCVLELVKFKAEDRAWVA